VSFAIERLANGSIVALLEAEGNGQGVLESTTDVSAAISGVTDVTLKLDMSSGDAAVGMIDLNSDGSFDITVAGSAELLDGTSYQGGLIANVPEPSTSLLVGSGLFLLGAGRRSRRTGSGWILARSPAG
jgi:hypothetical protein